MTPTPLKALAIAVALLAIASSPADAARQKNGNTGFSYDQHSVGYTGYYAPRFAPRYSEPVRHYKPAKAAKAKKAAHKTTSAPAKIKVAALGDAPLYSGADLVSKARAYMGTNPTGWSSLWCAKFMAMVAPDAARRVKNPNLARDWARAGLPRVAHCQVGTIAVLSRGRRGGHIGVVSECTAAGPKVVSGNHNRRVGEAVYRHGRVIAYIVG